jgi:hypothetical protein
VTGEIETLRLRKTAGILPVFRGFSIEQRLKIIGQWDAINRKPNRFEYISESVTKRDSFTKNLVEFYNYRSP